MKKPSPSHDKDLKQPSVEPKGYPLYPDKDDIYRRAKEEKNLDPEDLSKIKEVDEEFDIAADEDQELDNDLMGSELDVPGADLDDDQEEIGNEDEENNYYSIGGDNHNDLEEDNQTVDLEADNEES